MLVSGLLFSEPPLVRTSCAPPVLLSLLISVALLIWPSTARADTAPVRHSDLEAVEQRQNSKLEQLEQRQELRAKDLSSHFELVKDYIAVSQKQIDWWIAFLSVLMAFIGLVGIALPYVLTRNLRRDYEGTLKETREAAAEANRISKDIKNFAVQAQQDTEAIKERRRLLSEGTKDPEASPKPPQQKQAIADTLGDPRAPAADKLSALALKHEENGRWEDASAVWAALHALHPEQVEPLVSQSQALLRASEHVFFGADLKLLSRAKGLLEQAITLDPTYAPAYVALSRTIAAIADKTRATTERRGLLNHALSQVQTAVELNVRSNIAYNIWGNELAALAELADNPVERRRLLEDAITKHQKAIELQRDYAAAYNNWANRLAALARLVDSPAERRRLLEDAIAKYQKAIELQPDYGYAYNNWGNQLAALAELADSPAERRRLLEDALAKCQKAIELQPDYSSAYNNWGNQLAALAELADSPAERRRLLEDALAKYQKAIELQPSIPGLALAVEAIRQRLDNG